MKYRMILLLVGWLLFRPGTQIYGAGVKILTPSGGYTTNRIQTISGTVGGDVSRATVVVNGIPQDVPVRGGRFSVDVVVAPGLNVVELHSGASKDMVSFFARVPGRDIKIILTWDNGRYIDLWVTDPAGNKCYWNQPSTPSGGNLIANDPTGFGPQIFTMEKAMPGTYSIQVQYYSRGDAPVSRVRVYAVLFEGTPRERRREWEFVMTKEQAVYQIAFLQITEEELW